MDPLMVIMMEILRDYLLETHLDILMVKGLFLMRVSNWDHLVVNFLALYLEM